MGPRLVPTGTLRSCAIQVIRSPAVVSVRESPRQVGPSSNAAAKISLTISLAFSVLDWVSRLMTVETEIRILQIELGIQEFEKAARRREPVHAQQPQYALQLATLQRERDRVEVRLKVLQARQPHLTVNLRTREGARMSPWSSSRPTHRKAMPGKFGA